MLFDSFSGHLFSYFKNQLAAESEMDPPLATEFKRGVSGFHFFGDTANFSATSQGHGVTDSAPIGSSRGCRRGSEMQRAYHIPWFLPLNCG